MEFTLLFAALSGVAAAWAAVRIQAARGRLDGIEKPIDVLIGAAGIGIVTGRIVEMVLAGVNPVTNPFDIVLVRGGVSTVAASTAAVAVAAWTLRGAPRALDALAPAALAGLAGWHGGCLWTGSCLGSATGSGLGFALPGSDVLRHPTELYAAGLLMIGAVVVARLRPTLRPTGAAIAIAGLARLATEPIRPSITGGPVAWYAMAVLGGSLVAILGPRWVDRSRVSRES